MVADKRTGKIVGELVRIGAGSNGSGYAFYPAAGSNLKGATCHTVKDALLAAQA